MISATYRQDYAGEFVIVNSLWQNGKKKENREWIPNPIENQHISGRAACIGSSIDRDYFFDYRKLARHRGGLLSSKKLQTYGVGSIAKEMRLDFAVETNATVLDELVTSKYSDNNIVYTDARNCISQPGQFYLIPQNPRLLDIETLPYIAAFDNHQEIFLLGYNKETPVENPNWFEKIRNIMDAYSGVKFYLVGISSNMPDSWLSADNSISMTYPEFISYCDV